MRTGNEERFKREQMKGQNFGRRNIDETEENWGTDRVKAGRDEGKYANEKKDEKKGRNGSE